MFEWEVWDGAWGTRELGWLAASLGVGLLVLFLAWGWLKGALYRWRVRRRFAWAARAEDQAASVLRRAGYRILGREVELEWQIHVDNAPVPIHIRADYLVSRDGRSYVAEVKTGRSAPRIENSATRRQLLEYRMAYPVHGVLLVDMERRVVRPVVFPMAPSRMARWPLLLTFLAGLGVGIGAALWWVHR